MKAIKQILQCKKINCKNELNSIYTTSDDLRKIAIESLEKKITFSIDTLKAISGRIFSFFTFYNGLILFLITCLFSEKNKASQGNYTIAYICIIIITIIANAFLSIKLFGFKSRHLGLDLKDLNNIKFNNSDENLIKSHSDTFEDYILKSHIKTINSNSETIKNLVWFMKAVFYIWAILTIITTIIAIYLNRHSVFPNLPEIPKIFV